MMLNTLIKTRSFIPKYLEKTTPGWIGHLPFANWLVLETKPRILVELGTHYGNSYFTFCQSVSTNKTSTQCFAIDCWEGDSQAGTYGQSVFETVKSFNAQHYAHFSCLIKKTFDQALSDFDDGSIDLLHIDGLHTYEAVKHDFETWKPKLSSRAIVLFHDISVQKEGFGVLKFWHELKKTHPSNLEFSHNYGLGVIFPSNEICPYVWLKQSSFPKKIVQRVFSTRGIKLAVFHKSQ